jgi:hypothetical protein
VTCDRSVVSPGLRFPPPINEILLKVALNAKKVIKVKHHFPAIGQLRYKINNGTPSQTRFKKKFTVINLYTQKTK